MAIQQLRSPGADDTFAEQVTRSLNKPANGTVEFTTSTEDASDGDMSPCTRAMTEMLNQYKNHTCHENSGDLTRLSPRPSHSRSASAQEPKATGRSPSTSIQPGAAMFPLHQPLSFADRRKGSAPPLGGHLPQQSILKAIASRPPGTGGLPSKSLAESLAASIDAAKAAGGVHSAARLGPFSAASARTPSTSRLTALQSPCFFHERFDDAVNLDRVLEEIQEEDGFTHSRLMRTATSVREISKQLQRRPIRKEVRSIMIVTKARDNSLVYLTRELALWLLSTPRYGSASGVNVYVDEKLQNSKRFDAAGILAQDPNYESMLRYWNPDLCWTSPELFDLVLTLGGDGTVLYTSFALFQRVVPPVLAFSLGSLGFLTNFAFADYKKSLGNIMDQGMKVNLRMRFTCTVFRADIQNRPKGSGKFKATDTSSKIEGEQFEVLNELVIDRGPSPYVSNLELYGDDELMTVIQADGCIFSTPTGSTAYSLSAGGPLTHPSIPGIMLSPICPHTLSFRPMVLSDSMMLKVCIPKNSRSTAWASFDGKHRVELRRGDCVQIEAGRYPFPTVVGNQGAGAEWLESVRRSLRWNTRGAVQGSFVSSKSNPSQNQRSDDDPIAAFTQQNDDDMDDSDTEEEEEEWDINPDPFEPAALDSGLGASVVGSDCQSPLHKALFRGDGTSVNTGSFTTPT